MKRERIRIVYIHGALLIGVGVMDGDMAPGLIREAQGC